MGLDKPVNFDRKERDERCRAQTTVKTGTCQCGNQGDKKWYMEFVGHVECMNDDDGIKHSTVTEAEANRQTGHLRRKWWNGVEEDIVMSCMRVCRK